MLKNLNEIYNKTACPYLKMKEIYKNIDIKNEKMSLKIAYDLSL